MGLSGRRKLRTRALSLAPGDVNIRRIGVPNSYRLVKIEHKSVMHKTYAPLLLCSALIVQGCGQSQPTARTVQVFIDYPHFLAAAVVVCSLNRS
jgi:hypothetical protein